MQYNGIKRAQPVYELANTHHEQLHEANESEEYIATVDKF